ncbi:MAG: twin-arginine translocase TatA/TatE family subunit, partial [Desulfomonilia bacterium]
LILLVALIVLGPKKLPEIAKTIGKAMREFQRATDDFKRQVDLASLEEETKAASAREKKDRGSEAEEQAAREPQANGHPEDGQAAPAGDGPAGESSQENQTLEEESREENSSAPAREEPEAEDKTAPKRGEDAPMAYRPGEIEE